MKKALTVGMLIIVCVCSLIAQEETVHKKEAIFTIQFEKFNQFGNLGDANNLQDFSSSLGSIQLMMGGDAYLISSNIGIYMRGGFGLQLPGTVTEGDTENSRPSGSLDWSSSTDTGVTFAFNVAEKLTLNLAPLLSLKGYYIIGGHTTFSIFSVGLGADAYVKIYRDKLFFLGGVKGVFYPYSESDIGSLIEIKSKAYGIDIYLGAGFVL